MVLNENQKIGIGLICFGLGFLFLGIILFFDRAFLAIGNILFLAGVCFSIGFQRSMTLFTRKSHIRGTICFFLGIILVLMKWGLIGMLIEGFGFINLFGNFLPTVLTVARQIPGLSTLLNLPIIAQTIDLIAGKTLPKYSV